MSSKDFELFSILLKEYFGEIIANVAQTIGTHGSLTIRQIAANSGESIKIIKQALAILIQHQFVTFSSHEKGFVEYKIDVKRVLWIVRYPKYVEIAKEE